VEIKWLSVTEAYNLIWDKNPKKHDIGAISASIKEHGFKSPPIFDETINAIVAGNGRVEALYKMYTQNKRPPKNIRTSDNGEWLIPVIFGVNSTDIGKAIAYAIDDNNATLLGGDITLIDLIRFWDDGFLEILQDNTSLPATMDSDDLDDLFRLLNDNENDNTMSIESVNEYEKWLKSIESLIKKTRNLIDRVPERRDVIEKVLGELILLNNRIDRE